MRRLLPLLVALSVLAWFASAALAEPAQITVEGQGDYFVTGESYPVMIQVAGYNSRDNIYYLTFILKTTKTVEPGQTATFNYFIEVFDGTGTELGSAGSLDTPLQVAAGVGADEVVIKNQALVLTGLPAGYRVVITVKAVNIS